MRIASILQNDLIEFSQQAQDLSLLSWEQLWQKYSQGIALYEEICEAGINLASAQFVEWIKSLATAQSQIHNEILQQAPNHQEDLVSKIEFWINEFGHKIQNTTNNITNMPIILATHLRGYAIEILLIKQLAGILEKQPISSNLPDIVSEIHHLESQIEILPNFKQDATIQQSFDDLKLKSLQKELASFENEIQKIQDNSEQTSLEKFCEVLLWGNSIQAHMPSNISELVTQCYSQRLRMQELAGNKLELISTDEKLQFIKKLTLELEENIHETLNNHSDSNLSYTIQSLDYLQEDCQWLYTCIQKTAKTQRIQKPSNTSKQSNDIITNWNTFTNKLKKLQQLLTVELQEKRLQYRLETIFGHKFVAFSEVLLLVLTLLVIVLLFVEGWLRHAEHLFDIPPQYQTTLDFADVKHDHPQPLSSELCQQFEKAGYPLSDNVRVSTHQENQEWEIDDDAHTTSFLVINPGKEQNMRVHKMSIWVAVLATIDAVICFIFLLEFFTKFALVKGKWLYFRRHFLIDFLPAIPFGLLAASLENLNYARSARLLRLLRLQRMLRYVRILRPIMRIFRVVVFLLRGIDRLVSRYGRSLNRNIVFFSLPQNIPQHNQEILSEKINKLRGECLFHSRNLFRRCSTEHSHPFLLAYLQSLATRLAQSSNTIFVKVARKSSDSIPIETIVHSLLHIRGNEIEDWLGVEFPQMIYRYLGLLDAPLIRRIPGISRLITFHRRSVPTEFTAGVARMIGRGLQKILDVIYWFGDLYGIVTGPRLIDRVAKTLIESFKQPAKKLLTMGSVFVVANVLVSALPWEILKLAVEKLNHYVGIPLFAIGILCSIPLALGWWLKNIAGEATDFYERTSEAQFITLLKEIKWANTTPDLQLLNERVIGPELAISFPNQRPENSAVIKELQRGLREWWNANLARDINKEVRLSQIYRHVLLLYRDYLDGAVLHRHDMKTTKQFLGNLTLSNIRSHRLQYTKQDFKKLEQLDMEKPRIFSGPYLWFSLITDSVSHNVAQLIIDYNRHAIPQAILPLQQESVQQEYQSWLQHRLNPDMNKASPDDSEVQEKRRKQKTPLYLTTHFTALHFLSCNANRDENIRRIFGDDVYQAFYKDRQNVIKAIFGSYPLPELPNHYRTVNPYHLYQLHIANGRIFFLPFKMVYYVIGACWILIKWIYQKCREIINPALQSKVVIPPLLDFSVALRKINRMRKPVYLATMQLRAQYDFEYLGFSLDSVLSQNTNASPHITPDFEKDLSLIKALDDEYDEFFTLRQKRTEQLHEWQELMQENIWQGQNLSSYLDTLGQQVQEHKAEILRAITIAYLVNYHNFSTLLHLQKFIHAKFEQAIACQGNIVLQPKEKPSLWQKLLSWLQKDHTLRQAWEQAWQDLGYSARYGAEQLGYIHKAYSISQHLLKEKLELLSLEKGFTAINRHITDIALNPTAWSEELVALRTIQTLAVLDIYNYQKHVALLSNMQEPLTKPATTPSQPDTQLTPPATTTS